jgi:hypothetical protein
VRLAKWRLKFSPLCSSKRPWKPRSTHWPHAQRIGHGHQHHLARRPALQRVQVVAQVVGHQHAGHFVGMQRALDGHLGALAGRAVVQADQLVGGARGGGGERVSDDVHESR